jgi:GNAT superfamily N-acetyltransferase
VKGGGARYWNATAVRGGWSYLRRRGWHALLGAFFRSYIYSNQEYLILRTSLLGPPALDRVGDIIFRLATPVDLGRLDEFEPYGRGSSQRAAVIEDKDWLFVACDGDRIVMTRRYARIVPIGLMSRVVDLSAGQIWAADSFCLPAYRNRGIGRELGVFADRFISAQGYSEVLSAVGVANSSSIRMNMRIGRRPLYHVSYFRLLFYEDLAVSKHIPAEYWPG